jgi:hypothetical protein
MKTLDEIASYWGTDKARWGHNYTELYEELMSPHRQDPVKLLELGWGSGCSAAAWMEYFQLADICIVDNLYAPGWPISRPSWVEPTPEPPPEFWDNPRLFRYYGDQADIDVVARVVDQHGEFDFIVDDASHMLSKTKDSFALLWPHVKPGGYYFIEDVCRAHLNEIIRMLTQPDPSTPPDPFAFDVRASHHPVDTDFSIAWIQK